MKNIAHFVNKITHLYLILLSTTQYAETITKISVTSVLQHLHIYLT